MKKLIIILSGLSMFLFSGLTFGMVITNNSSRALQMKVLGKTSDLSCYPGGMKAVDLKSGDKRTYLPGSGNWVCPKNYDYYTVYFNYQKPDHSLTCLSQMDTCLYKDKNVHASGKDAYAEVTGSSDFSCTCNGA